MDIKSLSFSVSVKTTIKPPPAARARILGKMEIKQWLQVSGELSHKVAVFSIEDLKRHVSDSFRQKIPSLKAHFSVYLRFEACENYSSVQVQDSQGILYVPSLVSAPPAPAAALRPLDPAMLASLV